MHGSKYEKYGRPTPPADPDADIMTVQETAYVLMCSVPTIHRRLDALGLKKKPGRRVVTNKAIRAQLLDASDVPAAQKRAKPRKRGTGRKQLVQRTSLAA